MKNDLTRDEWLALAAYLAGKPLVAMGETGQTEHRLRDFKAAKKKIVKIAKQLEGEK